MDKVKINRIHFVEVENIDRIEETKSDVRVYLKSGYPKILKANCTKTTLLVRMVNVGVGPATIKWFLDKK